MKVFLTLAILLLAVLSISTTIDTTAMAIHDASLNRALAAFGIAKGLNAVISLFQGTQLSFSPIGMGVNISVGEILDPLNDLIERFSWVMLAASISLGIQKFFLILGTKAFIQLSFLISSLFLLSSIWVKQLKNVFVFSAALRLFLILFVLRFATVIFMHLDQFIYISLMQNEYNTASTTLTTTNEKLSREFAVHDSASFKEMFNIKEKVDKLSQTLSDASKQIITLSTVFVLNSIILPLLFMWVFIIAIKFALIGKVETESILRQIAKQSE